MKTTKGTKKTQTHGLADRTLIPAHVLRDFGGRVFRKCGVSEDDARAESGIVKKKRAVNHKEHRELKEGKAVTELGFDTHWVRQHQRANLFPCVPCGELTVLSKVKSPRSGERDA